MVSLIDGVGMEVEEVEEVVGDFEKETDEADGRNTTLLIGRTNYEANNKAILITRSLFSNPQLASAKSFENANSFSFFLTRATFVRSSSLTSAL